MLSQSEFHPREYFQTDNDSSSDEISPRLGDESLARWPPHLRHLQHLRPRDQYPMTIFPPDCWYVLHPPGQFEGELKDLGFVPGTTPIITFSTASSTAMRVMVGTIRGKTDSAGTLMFNDTSGVTMWEVSPHHASAQRAKRSMRKSGLKGSASWDGQVNLPKLSNLLCPKNQSPKTF